MDDGKAVGSIKETMMKATRMITAAILAATTAAFALPVLAQQAPAPGNMPMMQAFDQFDANKDGKITQDEIKAARAAETTALDADKDGKISAAELVAQDMQNAQARAEMRAKNRIERLDTDGDGMLSAAELAARPMQLKMFDRLDANNDGAVDKDELAQMRGKMRDGRGEGRDGRRDDRRGDGWGDCDDDGWGGFGDAPRRGMMQPPAN
ncbi:hypothetical protein CCR83_02415 [Rhodobacter veldkampii DSM 11550]|uniref:Calcium-binding protein n=2 Tax=Phaeovulum veldkampii TaxID=33049 RepID=A0A2T4JMF0_9RHOB|nr:hypothetical protein [Phaeovulum veldkampii DSM 11550]PTE19074.1 calcium-binding protein [Phaeovulum veldkampii DSM 11550]